MKDFYPELSEQGKIEVQLLMNKFEKELREFAIKLIKETTTYFYTDISTYIESDHWTNYKTQIFNAICDYSNKKTCCEHDYAKIRQAIYLEHKEEIDKDLNQDLLKEIEYLKRMLNRDRF